MDFFVVRNLVRGENDVPVVLSDAQLRASEGREICSGPFPNRQIAEIYWLIKGDTLARHHAQPAN